LPENSIKGKPVGQTVVLMVRQASICGAGSAVLTKMGYAAGQMFAGEGRHSLSVLPSNALTARPGRVQTQLVLAALDWLLGILEQLTGTNSCRKQMQEGGSKGLRQRAAYGYDELKGVCAAAGDGCIVKARVIEAEKAAHAGSMAGRQKQRKHCTGVCADSRMCISEADNLCRSWTLLQLQC
jgi:hypothetical protein